MYLSRNDNTSDDGHNHVDGDVDGGAGKESSNRKRKTGRQGGGMLCVPREVLSEVRLFLRGDRDLADMTDFFGAPPP